MEKNFPRPDGTGVVQGDSAPMPDRGTKTGFNGDSYEADTSCCATNRMGSIAGDTKSHNPDERPGCNNRPGC